MPTIEIDIKQLRYAIAQLKPNEKMELVDELEKVTWQERFKQLLQRIDQRVKEHPVSEKQIERICKEVRKERYDQRHH